MEEALADAVDVPESDAHKGVAADELDGWMRYFGVEPEEEE